MIAEITIDRDTYGLELTTPIVIDVALGGGILSSGSIPDKYESQTGTFYYSITAGWFISEIHIIKKTGTPVVSCVEDYLGDIIIPEDTVIFSKYAKPEEYYPYNENLNFTITGGTVDIIIYRKILASNITNMNFPYTLPHILL